MTLDEAICKEEALAYSFGERYKRLGEPVGDLPELEAEHKQYAEWLKELVHLRNITEYLRDMVTCFEFMGSMHYNEDIIEWADSELRVDIREVNADDT